MESRNYAQLVNTLRIPIREIARLAGYSHTTVKKVLDDAGEPWYSDKAKKKILEVIDQEVERIQDELKGQNKKLKRAA